jgi:hypothetical protein
MLSKTMSIPEKLRDVVKCCLERIFAFPEDSVSSGQISEVMRPKKAKTCFDEIIMVPSKESKHRATQTENSPTRKSSI